MATFFNILICFLETVFYDPVAFGMVMKNLQSSVKYFLKNNYLE